MYQHLQSSIIFPLLPFLPWAMMTRIVIIWRSNLSPQAAFRALEQKVLSGWERQKASLWFTNSVATLHRLQQIFCDVARCYEEWKASCDSASVKTLQTHKGDVLWGWVLPLWVHRAECLRSASCQTLWVCILDFKHKTYVKLFDQVGLTQWILGPWELWSYPQGVCKTPVFFL